MIFQVDVFARLGYATGSFRKLSHLIFFFRIAETEAVTDGGRYGSYSGHISHGLRNSVHRSPVGVNFTVPWIIVCRKSNAHGANLFREIIAVERLHDACVRFTAFHLSATLNLLVVSLKNGLP